MDQEPPLGSPPANPPSNEFRTSARHDIVVALIAVFAALGGSISGALVSGYYTSETTADQIAANAAQANMSALRSQRQEAYAALLAEERGLLAAEQVFASHFYPGAPIPAVDQISQQAEVVSQAYSRFDSVVYRALLLGSPETVKATTKLRENHYALSNQTSRLRNYVQTKNTASTAWSIEGRSYVRQANAALVLSDAFMQEARKDVGNS